MTLRWTLLLLLAGCVGPNTARHAAELPGEQVAPGITLLRGRFVAGAQPDGNSVLLRAPRGLVVFDTGRHVEHAQRILDAARSSGAPIAAIVNSHWHLDHVSGNVAVRAAYPHAEVIASDAIRDALGGFLADYRAQLVAQLGKAPAGASEAAGWRAEIARIDAGPRLLPTRSVRASGTLDIAGRRYLVGLERNAVSGGDVWLFDPGTRTLLAGDLVTLPAPLFDTACAAGWRDALARLDALPFERLVPGHGAPMSHARFALWRTAFERLLACADGDADVAMCKAAWRSDAGPLIDPGDVPLADSLLDYYLPQVLRAPPPRRQRYCASKAS